MRYNYTINVAVWAVLFLAIASCVAILKFGAITLCAAYKTTNGIVTEKFPDNHLGISYRYEVNGHAYEGKGYAGQINRVFANINLGDVVTVFYAEHKPNRSTLEFPNVLLIQCIGKIIGISAILSTIGMCLLQRYRWPYPSAPPTP